MLNAQTKGFCQLKNTIWLEGWKAVIEKARNIFFILRLKEMFTFKISHGGLEYFDKLNI